MSFVTANRWSPAPQGPQTSADQDFSAASTVWGGAGAASAAAVLRRAGS